MIFFYNKIKKQIHFLLFIPMIFNVKKDMKKIYFKLIQFLGLQEPR